MRLRASRTHAHSPLLLFTLLAGGKFEQSRLSPALTFLVYMRMLLYANWDRRRGMPASRALHFLLTWSPFWSNARPPWRRRHSVATAHATTNASSEKKGMQNRWLSLTSCVFSLPPGSSRLANQACRSFCDLQIKLFKAWYSCTFEECQFPSGHVHVLQIRYTC